MGRYAWDVAAAMLPMHSVFGDLPDWLRSPNVSARVVPALVKSVCVCLRLATTTTTAAAAALPVAAAQVMMPE
jgi:hypothetical protein